MGSQQSDRALSGAGLAHFEGFLHEQPPARRLKGGRENTSAIEWQRAFKVKKKHALRVLSSASPKQRDNVRL
jgi:hypothetical protein